MTAQRATTVVLPALFLLLTAIPASAQRVRATVQIQTGPITGRVIIGSDARGPVVRGRAIVVERSRRPGERIVVERRDARRVRIVEDFRASTQRSHARHDDRHVVAWWDSQTDDYGFQRWRSGLHRVVLCEHGDKFYVLSDQYAGRSPRDDDRYDRDGGRFR